MALESQPLSNEQMRRTWAMVDVLTSLKRRPNQAPPTADFIRRKFEALSIPATETLSILMALTLRKENCPLAHFHVYGMAHAVGSFPKETASEVAHVLACDQIVSAAALKTASLEASHVLRLGLQHLAEAQKRGIPLCPIPTDLHACAMKALAKGGRDSALKILGVGDATVQESGSFDPFVSSKGLLTGTAFCIAVIDRLHLPTDICCGTCHRIVSGNDVSICRRCGDHLACKGCLGHAQHMRECERVRSNVRCMAQSLKPHIRESVRRVAVVQLSSSGFMIPMLTTSIVSPLYPSSLWESLWRCSTVVTPGELQVYWSLLIPFLAHEDGDEQETIVHARVYDLEATKHTMAVEQPTVPTSKGPKLLPSERRRIQKERRATEKRANEEARVAADSLAMEEDNAVLERQSARPDATSAMLTSVLAKRGSTASPEVVTRARARRDSLKADERRARKHDKTRAKRNPAERVPDTLLAAALHIQQHTRAWLRRLRVARRKQRSRAAKHMQSSVRTWLLSRDTPPVMSSIPATAVEIGSECDGEDQSLCVVCLERPRVMLFLTCAHLCACEACAPLMHACPLCRAEGALLRVYT